MKEIISIVTASDSNDFYNSRSALATVVNVQGSSYRRTGARMLIRDDGIYVGGISGGCLEGDTLRRAQKAIFQNKPSLITYDTTQGDAHQVGVALGCNGIIDILITPLEKEDEYNPVYLLSKIICTRAIHVLVTVTRCEENAGLLGKTILYENKDQLYNFFGENKITEDVVKDINNSLNAEKSQSVIYNSGEKAITVFIEIILPTTNLVVYGGNYDIHPLIRIAAQVGYDVTVVTNRSKVHKDLFQISKILDSKAGEEPVFDERTAVLIMSHDYNTDKNNLKKIITTTASYIGLLGPHKRGIKIFNELEEEGTVISDLDKERIYSPCGLDIGASSPEEIALSILSEINAHFTNRKGSSLKFRKQHIHDREFLV